MDSSDQHKLSKIEPRLVKKNLRSLSAVRQASWALSVGIPTPLSNVTNFTAFRNSFRLPVEMYNVILVDKLTIIRTNTCLCHFFHYRMGDFRYAPDHWASNLYQSQLPLRC